MCSVVVLRLCGVSRRREWGCRGGGEEGGGSVVVVSRRERVVLVGGGVCWRSVGWQSARGCGLWEETGGARQRRAGRARQERSKQAGRPGRCAKETPAEQSRGERQRATVKRLCCCSNAGRVERWGTGKRRAPDDLPWLSDAGGGEGSSVKQ